MFKRTFLRGLLIGILAVIPFTAVKAIASENVVPTDKAPLAWHGGWGGGYHGGWGGYRGYGGYGGYGGGYGGYYRPYYYNNYSYPYSYNYGYNSYPYSSYYY